MPQTPVLYGKKYATLLTSRGCPYHCTFCHNVMGKKFRTHSPQRVLAEIAALRARLGVTDIEIADDTSTLTAKGPSPYCGGSPRTLAGPGPEKVRAGAAEPGLKLYLCGVGGHPH